jgi:hypothetical protein
MDIHKDKQRKKHGTVNKAHTGYWPLHTHSSLRDAKASNSMDSSRLRAPSCGCVSDRVEPHSTYALRALLSFGFCKQE